MADEITEDLIYGGRLRIRQPARGYRVNVDTILLAAAVDIPAGARLMEAACGVGAASLAVAVREARCSIVGVERDAEATRLAHENIALNAMADRVTVHQGDALDRAAPLGVFDGVFFNPPFDDESEGRAHAPERRDAHAAEHPIDRWVAALADRLSGGGALTMIYRAHKLTDILAAFDGRLGGIEILPVRPRRNEPAKRVLVRARKGSRAPLKLLAGLDLHDASGAKHTPEIEAILRGETVIRWA